MAPVRRAGQSLGSSRGDAGEPPDMGDLATQLEEERDARARDVSMLIAQITELRVMCMKAQSGRVSGMSVGEGLGAVAESRGGDEGGLGTNPTSPSRLGTDVLNAETQEYVEDHHYRSLRESVWDAGLFLGVFMPWHQSVFGWCLLSLNTILQVLFTVVIITIAEEKRSDLDEDGMQAILLWRLGVGHDVANYDDFTQTSLVNRVCGSYGGRTTSQEHADALDNFKGYLQKIHVLDFHILGDVRIGECLAVMVLVVWVTKVVVELVDISKFAAALMTLPHKAEKTRVRRTPDGGLRITCLATTRLAFLWLLVIIPRTVVAIVLGLAGCEFLVRTSSIDDLMLNAVALSFVFDVDADFYKLLPSRIQNMVQRTDRLPIQSEKTNGLRKRFQANYGVREIIVTVAGVFVVFGFWIFPLQGVIDSIVEGRDLLCAGNQNFVFASNSATSVVYIFEGTAGSSNLDFGNIMESGPQGTVSLSTSAVLEKTGLQRSLTTLSSIADKTLAYRGHMLYQPVDVLFLQDIQRSTREDLLADLPCADQDGGDALRFAILERAYTWTFLEGFDFAAVRDEGMTCAMLEPYCFVSWQPRATCPITCRCTDLYYGNLDVVGCPVSCASAAFDAVENFQARTTQINSAMCVDTLSDPGAQREEVATDWVRRFISSLGTVLSARRYITRNISQSLTMWNITAEVGSDLTVRADQAVELGPDASRVDFMNTTLARTNPCRLLEYIRVLFDMDLCLVRSNIERGIGTMTLLCPVRCGTCQVASSSFLEDATDTSADHLDIGGVFINQEADLGLQVIVPTLPRARPLVCGTDVLLDTSLLPNYAGLPGGDAYFSLAPEVDIHYTVDLCDPGFQVDTVLVLTTGEVLDTFIAGAAEIVASRAANCGPTGPGATMSLSGLDLQNHTLRIDSNSRGGVIALSFRCSATPLFWEVARGSCTERSVADMADKAHLGEMLSCIESPGFPADYTEDTTSSTCLFRIFNDAWTTWDRVPTPDVFWVEPGDCFEIDDMCNTNNTFEQIGQRPVTTVEWKPDGVISSAQPKRWRFCANYRLRQPWLLDSGPCARVHVQGSSHAEDCILTESYPDGYSNIEHCSITVPTPWSETGFMLSSANVDTEQRFDYLSVDGSQYSGLLNESELADLLHMQLSTSVVWSSDESVTYNGWRLCVNMSGESG